MCAKAGDIKIDINSNYSELGRLCELGLAWQAVRESAEG